MKVQMRVEGLVRWSIRKHVVWKVGGWNGNGGRSGWLTEKRERGMREVDRSRRPCDECKDNLATAIRSGGAGSLSIICYFAASMRAASMDFQLDKSAFLTDSKHTLFLDGCKAIQSQRDILKYCGKLCFFLWPTGWSRTFLMLRILSRANSITSTTDLQLKLLQRSLWCVCVHPR